MSDAPPTHAMLRDHRLLLLLAGALVAAAGCHELPDIQPDVCGNLVIDADEDCDGFSAYGEGTACGAPDSEAACSYTCLADAVCPPGWGCGHDGRCRRPSGLFREASGSPWEMPVDSFAIGDTDGDGHADLIGNSQQLLMIRYGSPAADFQDSYEMNIRRPTGQVTYDHFDSDALLDVIVPTEEGLFVLRGDSSRTLDPVTYSSFVLEDEDQRMYTAEMADTALSDVFFVSLTQGTVAIGFLYSSGAPVELPPPASGGLRHPLPPATADLDRDGRDEVAFAYHGDPRVRVYRVVGGVEGFDTTSFAFGTCPVACPTEVVLPSGVTVAGPPRFADVDGDGDADLLVQTSDGRLAVALGNGAGSLAAPLSLDLGNLLGLPGGAGALVQVGDLTGDGVADYIFRDAVALAVKLAGDTLPSGLNPVAFATQGPWLEARLGDFNADGWPDLAAVFKNGNAPAGFEILVNGQTGLFNRFPVHTERPPRPGLDTLAVADFDGDLVDDIALVEDGRDVEPDSVSVVFGARDGGFGDPVAMGEIEQIVQIGAARMAAGMSGLDSTSDLLVLSQSSDDQALAVLLGDTSRRMIAPYFLSEESEQQGPGTLHIPLRAVVGDFDSDGVRDLLAIAISEPGEAVEPPPGASCPNSGPTAWVLAGEGEGRIDAAREYCQPLGEFSEFNFLCSTWETADLDGVIGEGTGATEILGIDDHALCTGFGDDAADPELLVVRVSQPNGGDVEFTPYHAPLAGDLSAPASVTTADLDGDLDLDPIVLFRGAYRAGPGEQGDIPGAGVAILWNQGGTPEISDYGVIAAPDGTRLNGVASLRLDEDPFLDLVLLTDASLYRALYDPDAGHFLPPEPLPLVTESYLGEGRSIAAGDLDGDGLEDLALVRGQMVTVLLAVPAPPLGAPEAEGVVLEEANR